MRKQAYAVGRVGPGSVFGRSVIPKLVGLKGFMLLNRQLNIQTPKCSSSHKSTVYKGLQ